LISNLNIPSFSLKLLPLVLSLHSLIKSLSPSFPLSTGRLLQGLPGAFSSPETTAAAEPPPEEFDNSTYKNLQHHEYNIYTFVDSVVALSKFRQPQPSSGRPSPRH
uniref:NADH dehydrogenase [ubiquinone] flavoprotein 3, mitochondrial n=1 Tax=Bubo bubo TaxID=30461 RepID=A0A8C0ESL0_BUBBB